MNEDRADGETDLDVAVGVLTTDDDFIDVLKLDRMHAMITRTLEELRSVDADASSTGRVEALTRLAVVEIGSAVPDDLLRELGRIIGASSGPPTVGELRVVEAQLLGWLHGLAMATPVPLVGTSVPGPTATLFMSASLK